MSFAEGRESTHSSSELDQVILRLEEGQWDTEDDHSKLLRKVSELLFPESQSEGKESHR